MKLDPHKKPKHVMEALNRADIGIHDFLFSCTWFDKETFNILRGC